MGTNKKNGFASLIPVLIIIAFVSQCGHNKMITSVAYSPDGELVVAGTADKTILVYNGSSGEKIYDIVGPHSQHSTNGMSAAKINTVAFRNDGNQFLSGGNDSAILIWDTFLLQYVNDDVQALFWY
jgi:WD40 repeat protein